MQEIKTIIQLRNDTTDNWSTPAGQATPLKPGEVAVEIVDGKAKLKIGTNENSTFGNSEYFGSETTQVYRNEEAIPFDSKETDLDIINSWVEGKALVEGDCAIIKREIFDPLDENDKDCLSYTSYVYNNGQWAAMDGNYSADTVYTSNDIVLAGIYEEIGNLKKGDTINAGTSLQTLLTGLLSQRIQPSIVESPKATISAKSGSTNIGTSTVEGEVGASYTLPTVTITVTTGKYTNEGTDTGVKYLKDNVTIAYGSSVATSNKKATNETELGNGGTVSILPGTYNGATSATYGDTKVSYTFSGAAHNEAGNVAKDNLGTPSSPEVKIAAKDISVSNLTTSFQGYRKMFMGVVNTIPTEINSAFIRGLNKVSEKASKKSKQFTAEPGDVAFYVAIPKKSLNTNFTTNTPLFQYDFMNTWYDLSGVEDLGEFEVEGANGYEATTYKVYKYAPEGGFKASTKINVTVK